MALLCRAKEASEDVLGIGAAGAERFPPQTLRLTTAGRRACSARQLVASTVGSKRKLKSAGSSVRRRIMASFQATMPLSPGTRLGHYDVTALLGEGGMGQV